MSPLVSINVGTNESSTQVRLKDEWLLIGVWEYKLNSTVVVKGNAAT